MDFGGMGVLEGIAEDVSEHDIKFRFMHLHEPAKNIFWPKRDDECWMPNSKVTCLISTATKLQAICTAFLI